MTTEIDTGLKEHSVIDRGFSSKVNELSYGKTIVLDTLTKQIDTRRKIFNDNNIYFEKDIDVDFSEVPSLEVFSPKKTNSFVTKSQDWIGFVTELGDETFKAQLSELNNTGTYEVAAFDLNEVSQGDISLLKKGAIFYWSVGYSTDNGQVSKKSFIRFKRSVILSEADIDEFSDRAADLDESIIWD